MLGQKSLHHQRPVVGREHGSIWGAGAGAAVLLSTWNFEQPGLLLGGGGDVDRRSGRRSVAAGARRPGAVVVVVVVVLLLGLVLGHVTRKPRTSIFFTRLAVGLALDKPACSSISLIKAGSQLALFSGGPPCLGNGGANTDKLCFCRLCVICPPKHEKYCFCEGFESESAFFLHIAGSALPIRTLL